MTDVPLPDPDFCLDGGALRCFYEATLHSYGDARVAAALKDLGDACRPALSGRGLPSIAIAAGDVQNIVSLGSRGAISLLAVERIEPRGEYPDEVTVVMKSGARFSVSAQSAGRPAKSDAMKAWSELIASAGSKTPAAGGT